MRDLEGFCHQVSAIIEKVAPAASASVAAMTGAEKWASTA
jgi:hypothetical protein